MSRPVSDLLVPSFTQDRQHATNRASCRALTASVRRAQLTNCSCSLHPRVNARPVSTLIPPDPFSRRPDMLKLMEKEVAYPFSVRVARPKSFRAALLGAAAGPASFADVVDRVKGAVVSVKVKTEESNVSYDGDSQPMPNFPKGGPLEKF